MEKKIVYVVVIEYDKNVSAITRETEWHTLAITRVWQNWRFSSPQTHL